MLLIIVTDLMRSCRSRMVSWWPEVTLALRFPQRRCSWPRRWWLVDVTGRGNPSSVPLRSVQYRITVSQSKCGVSVALVVPQIQEWSQCHCMKSWYSDTEVRFDKICFLGRGGIIFLKLLLWSQMEYMILRFCKLQQTSIMRCTCKEWTFFFYFLFIEQIIDN